MSLLNKILGPKSKYDRSLPYTYEARIRIFEDGSEHKTYLSDTICGLVEHLQRIGVAPAEAEILEIYRERETPIDARLLKDAIDKAIGAWGRGSPARTSTPGVRLGARLPCALGARLWQAQRAASLDGTDERALPAHAELRSS